MLGLTVALPQTGQMWLEHIVLDNPDYEGAFCLSTSCEMNESVPGDIT